VTAGADDKHSVDKIEYWRWRYRDQATGNVCRTTFQMSAKQAAHLPEAEPIPGTMSLRDPDSFENDALVQR
jgi:hypothetical protein